MLGLLGGLSSFVWRLIHHLSALVPKLSSYRDRESEFRRYVADAKRKDKTLLWVHVASAGELLALLPVLNKQIREGRSLFVTATSISAKAFAQELPSSTEFCLFPGDSPALLSWAMEELKPSHLLLCKHDLWPNLLIQAKKHGTEVVFFAPKPSSQLSSQLRAPLLKLVDTWIPESEATRVWAQRWASVQAVVHSVLPLAMLSCLERQKKLGLHSYDGPERRLTIGSAYLNDAEIFSSLHSFLQPNDWRVLVVPHDLDPRNLDKLTRALERHWTVRRVSDPQFPPSSGEIFILDQMGRLFEAYALSKRAWVGRGPRGVHNVLEPLSFGISVACVDELYSQPLAQDYLGRGLEVCLDSKDVENWLSRAAVETRLTKGAPLHFPGLSEWIQ
jgi:3-deoxy-D-manno-octulosonic-acid transferase